MTTSNKPQGRLYHMDALRAFAMALILVSHGAIFVLPDVAWLWPISVEVHGDRTYTIILNVIYGFRSPLFFLLSGFFTALLWERRGLRSLIDHRLKHVALPFAIGCFTLIPISVGILQAIAGRVGAYDFPLWQLPLVAFANLGHLWFLWWLLLYVGLFAIAVRWLRVDFLHPRAWWLAIPASMVVSLLNVEPIFGADTAVRLIPEPAPFLYFTCFFFFGAFMYRQKMPIRSWWTVALLPAVGLFWASHELLATFLEPFGGVAADAGMAFQFRDSLTFASALLEALFTWAMCFGFMGLFRWTTSRGSFAVRYLSDAGYWVYLAHLPVVIFLQLLVRDWPIHYHFKFLIVIIVSAVAMVASYQWGVRYTFIGRGLNGPRTRRPRRPASTTTNTTA